MRGIWLTASIFVMVLVPALCAWLHLRRRVVWAYLAFITAIAVGLRIAAGQGWHVLANQSHSLPNLGFVYHAGEPFNRGDLIAFRWTGTMLYPRGAVFVKRVAGVSADRIEVRDRTVYVNDATVGIAKPLTSDGRALSVTHARSVGPDEVFVATAHPDSFDSRYEEVGNVAVDQVLGRAYEIF